MFSHNLNLGWSSGNAQFSKQVTVQADGEINLDIEVPAGATDKIVSLPVDVSAVKSLLIATDQNVTIKTNSSGAPDNTLVLTPNTPLIWWTGVVGANPLTVDVTSLHIACPGANPAVVQIRLLQDFTP